MNWIAVFFIGLALGWALELILDLRFWSRRYRNLEVKLATCNQNHQKAEIKIGESQAVVALYQAKEDDYQRCQVDHAILANKHEGMETHIDKITSQLDMSEKSIGQLNIKLEQLTVERDELHNSLEAVGQWVETAMHQRVWDNSMGRSRYSRSKDQTLAYARTVTAAAGSHIGHATGRIREIVSNGKIKFQKAWPKRWLKKGYCSAWALVHKVNKKVSMPTSCSIKTT